MAKTREIKGRIKAVGNIQRITKTMQMIATARFQAASNRTTAAKPYAQMISKLVGELASATAEADGAGDAAATTSHPLLRKPDSQTRSNRELLLVLTSNRGLCGAYNANILRTAVHHLDQAAEAGVGVDVEMVGKKGFGYMKFNGRPLERYHIHFDDEPRYADVETLAREYMTWFTQGKYDAIRVLFMAFHTMAQQKPEILTLLPLQPPKADAAAAPDANASSAAASASVDYDFSPDPQTLLDELLPITVKVQLFQCFNEAVISEQLARMVAMKAATDAAQKMGRALKQKFNRARQTAITTELNEIVSGAAALS